jgi:hypothetical protein
MLAGNSLHIYTDGSSLPSPRRGGIGIRFLVIDSEGRVEDFWIDEDVGQQLNMPLLHDPRRAPTRNYSDLEAAIALARLLHHQFQRYGTDSTEEITDAGSREAMRTLVALTDRLDITFSPPVRDLSGFWAYWGSHGGYDSWAARRGMLQELFDPLHEELERLEEDILRGKLAEPVSPRQASGWPAVDLEIAELRRHFHSARTVQDYRKIGNDVVAVLEAISAAAYDPARHLNEGETEPPLTQTKNRLVRIIEVDSERESSEELRKVARAMGTPENLGTGSN